MQVKSATNRTYFAADLRFSSIFWGSFSDVTVCIWKVFTGASRGREIGMYLLTSSWAACKC